MKTNLFLVFLCLLNLSVVAQKKNNFEDWSAKPSIVKPGENNQPPSDAMVLFDKNSLDKWEYADGTPVKWEVKKDYFTVVVDEPNIYTREKFGDCQLHIEWRVPEGEQHEGLRWGNSGIFFMGQYEVQIYDSYKDKHEIYYNGQAGSIYKQHSPLVNCCKPPGEWQSYDIIFTAPEFYPDKTLKSPAAFTVMQNGVLVQNHVELIGPTSHGDYTQYEYHESALPLMLQTHESAVSFRNIWIRKL